MRARPVPFNRGDRNIGSKEPQFGKWPSRLREWADTVQGALWLYAVMAALSTESHPDPDDLNLWVPADSVALYAGLPADLVRERVKQATRGYTSAWPWGAVKEDMHGQLYCLIYDVWDEVQWVLFPHAVKYIGRSSEWVSRKAEELGADTRYREFRDPLTQCLHIVDAMHIKRAALVSDLLGPSVVGQEILDAGTVVKLAAKAGRRSRKNTKRN